MKGSRKLLISVIALVITLAMAVTSTYAWFTTNTYVSVSGFDVNVKTESDEGLFVKIESPTYTGGFVAELTPAQIMAAINYNVDNAVPTAPQLKPLTTTNRTVFYELADDVINGSGTLTASGTATLLTSGYYAKITLTFQSLYAGSIVLVGNVDGTINSQIIAGTGSTSVGRSMTAWDFNTGDGYEGITAVQLGYGSTDYAAGAAIDLRAYNAARVTFASQSAGDSPLVWAPNAINSDIQTGFYQDAYGWTVVLPDDYYATSANEVTLVNVTSGAIGEPDTLTEGTRIATLVQEDGAATYTATIDIYIWLDGNDGSCINNISGDIFKLDLIFRRAAPQG